MSVPAWQRNLSKTQYLYETFKLNKRIGQIVMGKPKKYRENYGDHLIKTALDALKYCQAAIIAQCDIPENTRREYDRRRNEIDTEPDILEHRLRRSGQEGGE